MLYKIREKWQHRYFAVLVIFVLVLLTCVLLAIMMSLCNGSSGGYDDAYYFLIKGVYIPFFSLALLDIVISFVKRMLQEREYKSVINEMNGRPKMLNKGLYEVEYLPVSRCIINVNFDDIWYK